MPSITAITPEHGGRIVCIYVDGALVRRVVKDALGDLHLRVGQSVSIEELGQSILAQEIAKATQYAARYLESRARSKKEVERRLASKGYDSQAINQAVATLAGMGYIDDLKFAADWVQSRSASRPSGIYRLRNELAGKGVSSEATSAATSAIDSDSEVELARQALKKHIRTFPVEPDKRQAEVKRLVGFLQRRGFSWSASKAAIDAQIGGDDDSPAIDPSDYE